MRMFKRYPRRPLSRLAFTIVLTAAFTASLCGRAGAAQPDFGSNVIVFDPSMPVSQIQTTLDGIATQQVDNEFGTQRYALLFKPGTYGSVAQPLTFQVGYYTEVAGLGASPGDVTINGHIDVYNRCLSPNNCIALVNFWRSLSNLTINVMGLSGCRASGDFWAVSQAASMRRVNISGGNLTLMDYCTAGPQFASGGFIADSQTGFVINGAQQQFLVRNSDIGGWSNGVWNQVFSGVTGAPAQSFPNPPYTTLAASPVTREKPYLYVDGSGNFKVFVPAVQHNSTGTSWGGGATPGSSIPITKFFIAKPTDSAAAINHALDMGMNLILTPGVYSLDRTLRVMRADTVVLGLGFPTLVPQHGIVSMQTGRAQGIMISGIIFDAGTTKSPALLVVGLGRAHVDPADPSGLHDVFFRIGGATPGKALASLVVNGDNVILDNVWAWRADHGNGVGWSSNPADFGVVVSGDNVTAYGLFVEHYQKYEVFWSGNGGTDIFFQNEMPYDVPDQASWMEARGVNGWAAFKVAGCVKSFTGYGMGSYSNFSQPVFAANAFEVPTALPSGSLHDVFTLFLGGQGGISNVINGTGGSATAANPDVVVPVLSYP
ncbi:MAG TPA: coagulation factor 5/8 type domain-containing protein [Terriglobales bacterium]|nr:coagulation factor 5/8 type domain-containing protein [Terriglobales bacterium]